MIIPLSFYALVYYRFRCIVERPVDEFYVLAAKIRFSFVTSKKLTKKNL